MTVIGRPYNTYIYPLGSSYSDDAARILYIILHIYAFIFNFSTSAQWSINLQKDLVNMEVN